MRPIFVLGMQRSGTTWAANLLAAHPQIAAVTAEDHQGVHESVFFSHFAHAFGDWKDPEARQRFEEAFHASDYGRLAAVHVPADTAPSPAAYFRAVMDRVAEADGASAWVEKSPHHTLLGPELQAAFPDAVFLCITRAPRDLLRSRLWSYGRVPPPYPVRGLTIAKSIASSVYHNRFLEAFAAGSDRAVLIQFAALKENPDAALAPLLDMAGLEQATGLVSAFRANSSFGSNAARQGALSATDRAIAAIVEGVMRRVPQPMLRAAQRRAAKRRTPAFPRWVWKRNGGPPFDVPMEG